MFKTSRKFEIKHCNLGLHMGTYTAILITVGFFFGVGLLGRHVKESRKQVGSKFKDDKNKSKGSDNKGKSTGGPKDGGKKT